MKKIILSLMFLGTLGYGAARITNADIASGAAIAFNKLASLSSGNILVGSAANVPTSVTPSGDVTADYTGAFVVKNASVIGKLITGYVSGSGTVASTDTILQAINKLNGNDALKQPLATLTTKGDLYCATGSSAVTRLPVSADGTVLTAQSGAACGVQWAAASGGGGAIKSWSGYFEDDCVWNRTSTSLGDFTADSTCTFHERDNNSFGTVSSHVSGSDKLPGIVIASMPTTGRVRVCATLSAAPTSSGQNGTYQLYETTTSLNLANITVYVSGTQVYSNTICGMMPVTATTSYTFEIRSRASSGVFQISNPGGALGLSTLEWDIQNF